MPVCSEKCWTTIVAITESRNSTTLREKDLVTTRKELEGQIEEMGPGDTEEHLRVSRDYVRTIWEIDLMRARIKTLADKIGTVIASELKGEQFDFDQKQFSTRISESELFHPDDDDDDEGNEPKPAKASKAGKASKPAKPAKEPPLPGLNAAAPSTDLINKGATFPGEFKIMRVDNRATVAKVASSREDLAEIIQTSIGGPYDLFKFETGDVMVSGAVILRVTFVGPAGPLADPKTPAPSKGSKKPNAKDKKAANATEATNKA